LKREGQWRMLALQMQTRAAACLSTLCQTAPNEVVA
jgi:hypothetical protein